MELLKRIDQTDEQPIPDTDSNGLFAPKRQVESPEDCFFYHTIDLPQYGLQTGGWDLRGRFGDYTGHVDVRGKRVLDVGAASGFLSFEAERYGAREIVSFDLDSARRQTLLPFAGSDFIVEHEKWCEMQTAGFMRWQNSYWLTHRLLRSKAKAFYGDVYDLPARLGYFDVVIVGAILEHLVDPLTALLSLSRHAADIIVINTDFLDTPAPLAIFNGRATMPTQSFVFWTYSIAVYDEYMKIMGFVPVAHHKNKFAATSPVPGEGRPMLERVALVYQRDQKVAPTPDRIEERRHHR